MSEPPPDSPAVPPSKPLLRKMLRWLALGGGAALLLVLAVLGGLVATTPGLALLAQLADAASRGAVRVAGVEGRLLDRLSIGSLSIVQPGLRLEVSEIDVHWNPRALLAGRLEIVRLGVQRITLETQAGDEEPSSPPVHLVLPYEIEVSALEVGAFELRAWDAGAAAEPTFRISALKAALDAGPERIQVGNLALQLPWGAATAAGTMATRSPFALDLAASLAGAYQERDYQLQIEVAGDLIRPVLTLTGQGGGLSGNARVIARSFAPVPIERAELRLDAIDPVAFNAQAPSASLQVSADLAVSERAGSAGEGLQDWEVEGPLRVVNALAGPWSDGRLPLESLETQLRWSAGTLRAEDMLALLSGKGRVGGWLQWRPDVGDSSSPLEGRLELGDVDPRALDARLPVARLAGFIEGKGSADAQQFVASLQDARLGIELMARHADASIAVEKLVLTQDEARVEGAGQLALSGEKRFSAALKLLRFDPQALVASAPQAQLNADLRIAGQIETALRADVDFRFDPSRLAGRELSGEGSLSLEPGRLSAADLWLELAGNRVAAGGDWGVEGDELVVSLAAPALGRLPGGVDGELNLDLTLGGTAQAPSGRALLFASRLQLPGGMKLAGLNAQGELRGGLDGALLLAVGVGELRGQADALLLEHAGLAIEGSRADHRIELNMLGAEGDTIEAHLQGGLDAAFAWVGRLEQFALGGRLALRLASPVSLEASANAVRLGSARLLAGHGGGSAELLQTEWTPQGVIARGRLAGLGVGLMQDLGGKVRQRVGDLRLGGDWDLQTGEHINGTLRVYRESGDVVLVGDSRLQLGLSALELRVSAEDGALALSLQAEGAQLGRLAASLSTRVERDGAGLKLAPDAPLLGSARLDMPTIAWLGRFAEAGLSTAGAMHAEFAVSGTAAAPIAVGRVTGRDLEIGLADLGLRLSGGVLEAQFDRDYLRIGRLEFVSPNRVRPLETRIRLSEIVAEPGRLGVSGGIDLVSGEGRFVFDAQRLPVLQRPDRWLVVSGKGSLDTGWDRLDIAGEVEADAGAIVVGSAPAPSLSDDVIVLGRERAPPSGFRLSADLQLRLGRSFYLSALGLDTRLAGGIRLLVRAGQPTVASGVIRMVDGVFEGYGQKLVVERSTVSFAGPPDNPSLNVTALRKGLEVEAGVGITGSVRRPRIRLVSSPNVPDSEKLGWIVLGRAPDSGSGADLGLLIPAAQALLGGPGGGITNELSSSLGLDQISIGQGDLNSVGRGATSSVVDSGTRVNSQGTVGGQVVTLGKRLSTDTFLAFEQSLVGAESIVKLTYQLGRRVSVTARGGTDNAIDIFMSFTFR